MNTKVVRIKEEEKTRETLEKNPGLLEAAEILKNGGLVAFPTEIPPSQKRVLSGLTPALSRASATSGLRMEPGV